jgi:hypothetical protein
MGKQPTTVDAITGKFEFPPQAPGKFELNFQAVVGPNRYYGYQEFELDRDQTDLRISGISAPFVRTLLEDTRGARVDPTQVQMVGRRKELSGPGEARRIDLSENVRLPPGRWEFALVPPSAMYTSAFLTNGIPVPGRTDGWNEYLVNAFGVNTVKFVLSSSPGAIHGTVTVSSQPVAGAPVFLEISGLEPARRLKEMLMTRTDGRGQYQFSGLAPGQYRLLATFEYQSPAAAELDAARAATVAVEETHDFQQDLDLFVAH